MKRMTPVLAVALILACVAACDSGNSGNPDNSGDFDSARLYLAAQPNITPVVTPRNDAIVWGAAPVIDPHYGGVLYEGTLRQIDDDPRPPLLPGNLEPLRVWVADPDNGVENRPAIIWFHGGGFSFGINSMHHSAEDIGAYYAERGYVGFSAEYRINTTVVHETEDDGVHAVSLCQWVQDNRNPGDPLWIQRKNQCLGNITAALHDALAMVRWLRQHADEFDVDPNRIVVAGFSAGAMIAANVAYHGDDVGNVAYWPDDTISIAASRPQAVIGASGCTYRNYEIDAGDVDVSFIASRGDKSVPYSCTARTIIAARNARLVAELTSYCEGSRHASELYEAHRDATDKQWTTFMVRELGIYDDVRPPSSAPICHAN
ncbi:MAG: alpha/beta hydrolase [Gammaproteobacteria bacterium]|nr:alpha/beta hydrolase [Gammaproteobacteria bacterium]